jgi:phosphatidylcholine synthase
MSPRWSACAVHLFTASGAAFALLALLAASNSDWRLMFLWLGVGLVVDGLDGPLARKVDVKRHAPHWDGSILDLVIDYLSYVFIPGFALVGSGLMPEPWGIACALFMASTSVIYFADTRIKAEDKSFVGFPAVWHMPILVLFVFSPPAWVTGIVVLLLGLAQFTELKFIHPVRTKRWREVNFTVFLVWFLLAAASVIEQFDPPVYQRWGLLVTSVWLLFAGMLMQVRSPRRSRRSHPEPRLGDI